ncbi:TRAP transporter large permease [Chloroflexota bacterium]
MLFFCLKVPIGFSMLLVGIAGLAVIVTPKAGLSLLGGDLFNELSNYSLTVFPMFILAGSFAFASGMGERIYDGSYTLFRRLPGSLTVASIVACAGFAAICGSSTATAATMGKIALPAMRRYNYDDSLATGAIAAAGGLGVLIPPSTIFIIYAILTEQSIGKLFVAGILPGILLASLMVTTAVILCLRNPALAPVGPPITRKQKISGIVGMTEALVLFVILIGGLSLGWFTPTQGGAALATAILLLSLARRTITWKGFLGAGKDSLRITCMIMVIIVGGIIFGRFMAISRLPFMLAEWLAGLTIPPIAIMIIILFCYVILGFFMDTMATTILTLPIIFPTVIALGFDPIWFGVMLVVTGETGVVTPPVGINVYVVHGVAENVRLETIFKGVFPFVGAMIVCMIILMIFPQIATWLPSFMTY